MHHIGALFLQQVQQQRQGFALFIKVVVPVVVPRLHPGDTVGLQAASNV